MLNSIYFIQATSFNELYNLFFLCFLLADCAAAFMPLEF